jgi:hypothetical protein
MRWIYEEEKNKKLVFKYYLNILIGIKILGEDMKARHLGLEWG